MQTDHSYSVRHRNIEIFEIELFNANNLSLHSPLAGIYLFKVNNGNTRTICEICSKLTVSSKLKVNFEQISHIVLIFPFLTLSK